MNENTLTTFEFIYSKNQDKQRLAFVGEHANTLFEMVKHVLNQYHKKADYIAENELSNFQSLNFTNAPLIILSQPKSTAGLVAFKPHLMVVTNILEKNEVMAISTIADSLPKSGILIVDDRDSLATIAKKERTDVLTISFKNYTHTTDGEIVTLLTSTNEKFPIKISGEENLRCIAAAKETLKRIGISSGQFYRAIATFAR